MAIHVVGGTLVVLLEHLVVKDVVGQVGAGGAGLQVGEVEVWQPWGGCLQQGGGAAHTGDLQAGGAIAHRGAGLHGGVCGVQVDV